MFSLCKCQDKPRSGIKTQTNLPVGTAHSQLEAHTGSPIPDTHFAHHPTVLLAQTHNCGLQGSAYTHCTQAYLTSTVSATLVSLLFQNTSQLPQVPIHYKDPVENLFLAKKNKTKRSRSKLTSRCRTPHQTSQKATSRFRLPTSSHLALCIRAPTGSLIELSNYTPIERNFK